MGAGGMCLCPKCDYRAAHRRGVPCQDERCPQCGAKLLREGSFHDKLLQERRTGQAERR
jgi:Zn-finger nucleic acid-binding protein